MSSGSSATWSSLLEEKQTEVREKIGQGCALPGPPFNDRSFRSAFESLCSRQKVKRIPPLEAKLLPSYEHIRILVKAVDEYAPDLATRPRDDTLEGLTWWISFAAIERGCKAGAKLESLTALFALLNDKVPRFTTPPGRFPNVKQVQKPLQEVYSLFVDSHLFLLSSFARPSPTLKFDPTQDSSLLSHIEELGRNLEVARGTYDTMVDQTAQDEERERISREQPNLEAQRRLPDIPHGDGTADREVRAHFIWTRRLGGGSYGEVDEVREMSTGASYARKHIHLYGDGEKSREATEREVKNEVQIMQKLRHHHIATVLFYLLDNDKSAYSIFMLPVADSDLLNFLLRCSEENYPAALTKQINPWFGCLLDALAYAHSLRIKHQDIKPSNILIKNNQPYLCDFGLAKDFAEDDTSTSRSENVQGTRVYRAPEVQPRQKRGRRADVFALGCVYSEMLTVSQGRSLEEFRDARRKRTNSIVFRDCLPEVEKWLKSFDPRHLTDLMVDQILNMIDADSEKRHTSEEALKFLKPERALFCVE